LSLPPTPRFLPFQNDTDNSLSDTDIPTLLHTYRKLTFCYCLAYCRTVEAVHTLTFDFEIPTSPVTVSTSTNYSHVSTLHQEDKAPILLYTRPSKEIASPSHETPTHCRIMQALVVVASVFTIIISILSVQIPRHIQQQQHRSNTPTSSQHKNDERRPMTDGTDSSSDNTISTPEPRKPWDPPFPTTPKRKEMEKGRRWLVLPPMTRTEHGPSGERVENLSSNDTAPGTRTSNGHPRVKAKEQPKNRKEDATPVVSILWTTIAVLAGMFLVLLFTILIAHCLAWFIVYKTEARLGEARRGLVQGGEMRLCLCARG
jgi:hypothetical protein